MTIPRLFAQIYRSPTLMTWGSFASRSLTLVAVLPLILTRLSTEEIALWYLFGTIISLQSLLQLGFPHVFVRVIAYALGGSRDLRVNDQKNTDLEPSNDCPNWTLVDQICTTMRAIFLRISLATVLILATFGTWAVIKPISYVQSYSEAWIAWIIIVFVSGISVYGNIYLSYLQGFNHIAMLRRWEILFSLGAIATSFLVLVFGKGLLVLVIANQIWIVLNVIRNRMFCHSIENGFFAKSKGLKIQKNVFNEVWPSSWKGGIGLMMSYGLVQGSGVFLSQHSTSAEVASYLLALRFIQIIADFSNAPFSSKASYLARLQAEGKISILLAIAKRGMGLSYWIFVLAFIGVGIFADPAFKMIGSDIHFSHSALWSLLGLAKFSERYGALHIQLYSTLNNIIWHVTHGITSIITLVVTLLLYRSLNIYAFPVGMIAGYVGFFSWYSARHSYQAYNLSFWSFDANTIVFPGFIILGYTLCWQAF